MEVQKNTHIPILDSLRAVAALSVCIYHFVCGPVNFITNKSVLDIFEFGAYGVQFFFVISGFIIPWSLYNCNYNFKRYLKFLSKRFIRLEPPYIFSILLVLLIYFLRKQFAVVPNSKAISIEQIFLHFGYFIPFTNFKWMIDVYWTLAIEFQFYLFIGIIYSMIISENKYIRFFLIIIMFSTSFIGTKAFLPYWLPVFLLGILLFLLKTGKILIFEFLLYSILAVVFIGVNISIPVMLSSLISTSLILFFQNNSSVILNWFGRISYSIYLIHTIIGTTLINVLSHYAHSAFSKVMVVFFGVIVSVIFSYATYIFIERPSKNWSSRIKI